jgi:hypothetical protein
MRATERGQYDGGPGMPEWLRKNADYQIAVADPAVSVHRMSLTQLPLGVPAVVRTHVHDVLTAGSAAHTAA